jgi:hypothetical protein
MDYEILVRGSNGAYSGAHSIAFPGAPARPIAEAQWPDVCAGINKAALARVDELEAKNKALEAEISAYKSQGTQAALAVVAVVDDQTIDDARTAAACKAIALEILKNKQEREISELRRISEEALAKIAALVK